LTFLIVAAIDAANQADLNVGAWVGYAAVIALALAFGAAVVWSALTLKRFNKTFAIEFNDEATDLIDGAVSATGLQDRRMVVVVAIADFLWSVRCKGEGFHVVTLDRNGKVVAEHTPGGGWSEIPAAVRAENQAACERARGLG
jgi:hypothetical protein